MAKKVKWSPEELNDLIKTLGKHNNINQAIAEHTRLWKTGRTRTGCVDKFEREGLGGMSTFLKFERTQIDSDLDIVKDLVGCIKKGVCNSTDLCNHLNLSPKKLSEIIEYAQHKGFRLEPISQERVILNMDLPKHTQIRHLEIDSINRTFKIAVASDIHKASLHARDVEFEDFVKYAHGQGCRDVLLAGDIVAGMKMYRGQQNEVETLSGAKQAQIAVERMPDVNGITYHFIGGNHDESFVKESGLDPLYMLAKERDDMIHHGYYVAMLDINGVKVELHHPDKAGAYAITYHMQKAIESTPGGMKPQIALYGHTHQAVFLPFYRNIACFYCGCFEDQTLYLKRKHIQPVIGGWILEVGVTKDNSIRSIKPNFIHYFHGTRYECNPSVTEMPSK